MTYNNTIQYILNDDALGVLQQLQENSVDLVLTDPPYFNVLSESEHKEDAKWDTQWKNEGMFLAWLELYVIELKRVLKPNGHFMIFTSTWQNINIANILAKHGLDILNNVVWFKDTHKKATGAATQASIPALRKYLTQREHILYAGNYEKYKGIEVFISIEYQLDLIKREALAPLISYFIAAGKATGKKSSEVDALFGIKAFQHYFTNSQFSIPTIEKYKLIVKYVPELMLNYKTGEAFESVEEAQLFYKNELKTLTLKNGAIEDFKKSTYRTFNASTDIFYSDVWTYTIPRSKDRHVCEKPLQMMLDIITTTTLPGHTVLDAFAGSGVVGEACARLNRNFIGIELQEKWADKGNARIRAVPNVI